MTKMGCGQGTANVLTDFFCTTTPIFVLWKVKNSRLLKLKIMVCGLMSLGLVVTAS